MVAIMEVKIFPFYKNILCELHLTSASIRQRFRIRHLCNCNGSRSVLANLFDFVLLNKII